MINLNLWIKEARTRAGLTQEELGNKLGRTKANISSWESGAHEPSVSQLLKISQVTGYPLPPEITGNNTSPAVIRSRKLPLISSTQPGEWKDLSDSSLVEGVDFLLTDLELGANAFALKIKGDSMLPDFQEGDAAIINPEVVPAPGDFVVAAIEQGILFRKYRQVGVGIDELVPLNLDFPPMRSDMWPFKIVGTMVEHRRYRKA